MTSVKIFFIFRMFMPLPHTPFLALTATAGKEMQKNIIKGLLLKNPAIFRNLRTGQIFILKLRKDRHPLKCSLRKRPMSMF